MTENRKDPKSPPPEFAYILSKAQLYCRIGRDKYRKGDPFKRPDIDASTEILDAIDRGMEQICKNRGWSREQPLEGIGIEGFAELASTLHFSVKQQRLVAMEPAAILDEMLVENTLTGMRITFFNRVSRSVEIS